MARIRTIKPEVWQDEKFGECSANARLLFIATWNLADDEGLLKWNPAYIRSSVFMYDDYSLEQIMGFMEELLKAEFIFPYTDEKSQKYGWIVNFRKHQKIDKPQKAKLPLPSLQNPRIREMYLKRDGYVCHICKNAIEYPNKIDKYNLSIDHLIPRSKGGGDEPSNLKASHKGCNSSKGNRGTFDECSENNRGTFVSGTGNREQGTGILETNVSKKESVCEKKISEKYDSDFEEFWKQYPRKDGSKQKAFLSYQKQLKLTSHQNLMHTAILLSSHHENQKTEMRFIPYATTWLNGSCWETQELQSVNARKEDKNTTTFDGGTGEIVPNNVGLSPKLQTMAEAMQRFLQKE